MLRPVVALSLTALPAMAEVPRVVTDILPVHSLTAMVMQGVGEPELLVDGSASPHDFALRPSQARLVQDADLVIWIGPELTPWLEQSLDGLGNESASFALLSTIEPLDSRELEEIGEAHGDHAGEHDHEEHHEDEHEHDDHEDGHNDHADEHGHDDHGHDDHGHGHAHEGADPHAWLSPANATAWVQVIADELSARDAANAATYRANAADAVALLDTLQGEIAADLAPIQGTPFLVFHDAYQYFENAFGLSATAALSISDATPPGPAHLREIQEAITAENIRCGFAEPQFGPSLMDTALEGSQARAATLDPLGIDLQAGPGLYIDMMQNMAAALVECLE